MATTKEPFYGFDLYCYTMPVFVLSEIAVIIWIVLCKTLLNYFCAQNDLYKFFKNNDSCRRFFSTAVMCSGERFSSSVAVKNEIKISLGFIS